MRAVTTSTFGRWFWIVLAAMLSACGGADTVQYFETTLTLEIEAIEAIEATFSTESVEYTVACANSANSLPGADPLRFEGSLELAGVGADPEIPTWVWREVAAFPAGECSVQLRGRNGDGEVIWTLVEPLVVAHDMPTEFYHFVGSNLFSEVRGAQGDAELITETPRASGSTGAHSVEYTLSCDGSGDVFLDDSFSDAVTIDGNLLVSGESTADFGSGPVPTSIWQQLFESLPAGPCRVELRALNEAGELLCTVDYGINIAPSTVTQLHAFIQCAE